MSKFLKVFFVLFLIFGLVGGVFGIEYTIKIKKPNGLTDTLMVNENEITKSSNGWLGGFSTLISSSDLNNFNSNNLDLNNPVENKVNNILKFYQKKGITNFQIKSNDGKQTSEILKEGKILSPSQKYEIPKKTVTINEKELNLAISKCQSGTCSLEEQKIIKDKCNSIENCPKGFNQKIVNSKITLYSGNKEVKIDIKPAKKNSKNEIDKNPKLNSKNNLDDKGEKRDISNKLKKFKNNNLEDAIINGEKYRKIDGTIEKFIKKKGYSTWISIGSNGDIIQKINLKDIKNAVEVFSKDPNANIDKTSTTSFKIGYNLAKGTTYSDLDKLKPETLIYIGNNFKGDNRDGAIGYLRSKAKNLNPTQQIEALRLNDKGLSQNIFNSIINKEGKNKNKYNSEQLKNLCEEVPQQCVNSVNPEKIDKKELTTILNSITKEEISRCIADNSCKNQQEWLNSYNAEQCSGSYNPFCSFMNDLTIKEIKTTAYLKKIDELNLNYNQKISDLNKKYSNICTGNECKKIKKSELENLKTNYNKELFNLAIADNSKIKDKIKEQCKTGFSNKCVDKINEICSDKKNDCGTLQELSKIGLKKTQVETNKLFYAISILANPDKDAIYAAKLFGFEPDYSNIPTMLKDPISSQICSAKINGYLDKTKTENGGVTNYGCTDVYSAQNDPNIDNRQIITGNPNCVNILVDLRAQRTQITPDNKVSISYSSYIRAPSKDDIEFFLAISYILKNGETKKQLLKPNKKFISVRKGGINTDFQTIDLPLNISRNLIFDTQNSFRIGILAMYKKTGAIYKQFSTNIPIISQTNYYQSILNTNQDQNNTVVDSQNQDQLNSNSMLDLIQV